MVLIRSGNGLPPVRCLPVGDRITTKEITHYNDVIMAAMASQITSLVIVYSTVYSGADQIKYQSSASLAFVLGIHRWPVNFPHKWPITRKMFPFDDVIVHEIGVKIQKISIRNLHLKMWSAKTWPFRLFMPQYVKCAYISLCTRPRVKIACMCYCSQELVAYISLNLEMSWWSHQMETFSALLARWPVDSPHKGQSRGALLFSLICAGVNNREAGDLRRHRVHYDITVMVYCYDGLKL